MDSELRRRNDERDWIAPRERIARLILNGTLKFVPVPHPLTDHERRFWKKLFALGPSEVVSKLEQHRRNSPNFISDEKWDALLAEVKGGAAHLRTHRWKMLAVRDQDEMVAYLKSDAPLTIEQMRELADRLSGNVGKIAKQSRSRLARVASAWKDDDRISKFASTEFRTGNIAPLITELRARGDDDLADTMEEQDVKRGGKTNHAVHHAAEIFEVAKLYPYIDLIKQKRVSHTDLLEMVCQLAERELDVTIDREAVRDAMKNRAKKRPKRAAANSRV